LHHPLFKFACLTIAAASWASLFSIHALLRNCVAPRRKRQVPGDRLEIQPGFSSAFGYGTHPAVVKKSTTIEHDGINARGFRSLCNDDTDGLGTLSLWHALAQSTPHVLVKIARRDQCVPFNIVNDLHINVC